MSLASRHIFAALVAASALSSPLHAQPTEEQRSPPDRDGWAWITITEHALALDHAVKQLNFETDPERWRGDGLAGTVATVELYGEDRSAVQASADRGRDAADLMSVRSDSLAHLFRRHTPLFLRRMFDAPFDTLKINRHGKLVRLKDLSVHYTLYFDDAARLHAFLGGAQALGGVSGPIAESSIRSSWAPRQHWTKFDPPSPSLGLEEVLPSRWTLAFVQSERGHVYADDLASLRHAATLELRGTPDEIAETGQIAVDGSTSCNSFGGSLRVREGHRLEGGVFINTEAFCGGLSWEVERSLLDILGGATTYHLRPDRLLIQSAAVAEGVPALVFARVGPQ